MHHKQSDLFNYHDTSLQRHQERKGKHASYIAHIENPETNKNKKVYYDAKVQVTKTEYTTIRFIVEVGCPNAEKLRLFENEEEEKGNFVIVLQKVFKSADTNLFNVEVGSKYIFQNNSLPFQPLLLTTSINEINLSCMEEDVWYAVTDMNLKYFGMNLQSSRKTSVEALPEVYDIALPDRNMYQNIK